jgi:nucleotide-binding universal stress UspA family protein
MIEKTRAEIVMINKILIAVDGSPPATRAVEVAIQLAQELGAQLAAVHVVDSSLAFMPEYAVLETTKMGEFRRIGRAALDEAGARVPASIQFEDMLIEGDPGDDIVATARKWGADLIVLGSESRGRLAHFLLGSTADSVIRKAPCPVVSVRAQVDVDKESHAAAAVA